LMSTNTYIQTTTEAVLAPTIPMQLKSSMILNIWKTSY
jgi:hypothetical protein